MSVINAAAGPASTPKTLSEDPEAVANRKMLETYTASTVIGAGLGFLFAKGKGALVGGLLGLGAPLAWKKVTKT